MFPAAELIEIQRTQNAAGPGEPARRDCMKFPILNLKP